MSFHFNIFLRRKMIWVLILQTCGIGREPVFRKKWNPGANTRARNFRTIPLRRLLLRSLHFLEFLPILPSITPNDRFLSFLVFFSSFLLSLIFSVINSFTISFLFLKFVFWHFNFPSSCLTNSSSSFKPTPRAIRIPRSRPLSSILISLEDRFLKTLISLAVIFFSDCIWNNIENFSKYIRWFLCGKRWFL